MNIEEALEQMPIPIRDDDEGVLSSGEVAAQRIARVLTDEFERMDGHYQSAFAAALHHVATETSRAEADVRRAFGTN